MKQPILPRQFSHRFRAMGTDVALWLWNDNEQRAHRAFLAIERFFAQTEARLSRFRSDSELSRLNRSAGRPFSASPALYDLIENALEWRRQTDGIFDPAVLNALLAAGYDRSFDAIRAEQRPSTGRAAPTDAPMRLMANGSPIDSSAIRLRPNHTVTLPAGLGLDLGGIAKGWAIQQAAHRLGLWGPCLVDAGGDMAGIGAPPTGPWVLTIAHPTDEDRDIAVLSLNNEAVATSSRVYRQWVHDGALAHHLIDPRTGAPADTNVLSVTVVAPRLPDAEIHAKTALILGETRGQAYLNNNAGIAAILVCDDGRQLTTGSFEKRTYVPTGIFAD